MVSPQRTAKVQEHMVLVLLYVQGDWFKVSFSKLNLIQDLKVKPIEMHTSLKGMFWTILYGWVRFSP